jgi:conjugative relaxase-like TrwC/TraI family protein
MLSLSKISSASGCDYYLELAREDYYLNGGEPPGRWYGQALGHFGLKEDDVVEAKTLKTLFAGYHPVTAEKLVQNPGSPKRTRGWDMTFSMPKSASVLWSQTTQENQQIIQQIHDDAVKAALAYAQEVAGHTRRGKGGREIDRADLLFAIFQHGTSRALDPNLHSHAVLQNIGVRDDGTTGTLHTQALYDHKMAIGAVYRLVVAHGMRTRLGVHVEVEKDLYEVAGVCRTVCDYFSTRSREIREVMNRLGVYGSKAAEAVTLATRHAKESAIPREQLFELWQQAGRMLGWSRYEAEKVFNRDPFQPGMEVPLPRMAEEVFEKLVDNNTVVSKKEFLTRLATRAVVHGASLEQVKDAVEKELSSKRVVQAGLVGTEMYFTRADLQNAEASLAQLLKQAQGTRHHVLSREIYRKVIRDNPNLSDEQKQAVRTLTRRKGSVACLTGIAGAGKSTTNEVTKQAYLAAGYTVIGVAPTNQVARAMEESLGVPSTSIHALVNRDKGREVQQEGKKLVWKVDSETMESIRKQLPSTTILKIGALRIEAQATRPLAGLHDGLLRGTRLAQFLGKTPWGYIKVSLPRRDQKPLTPKAKPWRTLFSMAGVRLEVWKHPPCWKGMGSMGRIQVPFLKLNAKAKDPTLIDKKTVIFVDEAGMVDTKLMKDLLHRAAAAGAKVILTGDGQLSQLQPIQAGNHFREIVRQTPSLELKEIRRQKSEADRAVVRHLASGQAEKAIQSLIERGRYHEAPTKEDAAAQLAQHWSENYRENPRSCLIVAATNRWNDHLNKVAQQIRRDAGLLGPETVPVGSTEFRTGDRVLFTGKSKDIGVIKGDFGTVTAIRGSLMTVQLDTDKKVTVPTATFQDIRLGYSVTTHRSQGSTVDNVLIMPGPTWINRELSYVQASRARNEIHIFCDEKTAGVDQKNLIRRMNRSERKGTIPEAIQERRQRIEDRLSERKEEKEQPPLDRTQEEQQRRSRILSL